MTNVTIVSKSPDDEFFVVSFTDFPDLHWHPQTLILSNDTVDILGGPRYEAWERHRNSHLRDGAMCCFHGERKHCVCTIHTVCPIHGQRHHGSHE